MGRDTANFELIQVKEYIFTQLHSFTNECKHIWNNTTINKTDGETPSALLFRSIHVIIQWWIQGEGVPGTRPPQGPNSFILMQFLA